MSDSLFRISLKAFIENEKGEVLVVKETGRTWWDLPGGGMEHGESMKDALVRELKEEVGYGGDFEFNIFTASEPRLLLRGVWNICIVARVVPANLNFSVGNDGDAIDFKDPDFFKDSHDPIERLVCYYARRAKGDDSYDPHAGLAEKSNECAIPKNVV